MRQRDAGALQEGMSLPYHRGPRGKPDHPKKRKAGAGEKVWAKLTARESCCFAVS